MKNIVIFSSIILMVGMLVSSCDKPPVATWQPVGTLISMEVIPTSWNERIKSRVETTEGIFIIWGVPSYCLKGTEVLISNYKYLFIRSDASSYRLVTMQ